MKWFLLGLVLFGATVWAQPVIDAVPLHHLVLVSFTENSTAQQRQQVIDDSLSLLREIPGVETVAAGRKAASDRPVHIKDYDVAIYVRLSNEKALANYSSHPKHLQLLQRNKPAIGAIKVIDFLSNNTNVDSLAE
ncbi:MAG: Dabb family protein [Ketobacter sp.]|nr:MAG: Dabb family protein [Ketobacter sp.]